MNRNAAPSRLTMCALPALTDSTARPITASFWLITTSQATKPTTMVLATALSSSTSELVENMLPRPLAGLSLPKLGMKDLAENSQPPISSGEASATTMTATASGRQVSSTSSRCRCPTRRISTSGL